MAQHPGSRRSDGELPAAGWPRPDEAYQIAGFGSWEWDVVADRVTWSDELYRIYGLEPREFGATYREYIGRVHPDDREAVEARIARALEAGGGFEFEERIVRPDGEVRTLRSRGAVHLNALGRPARVMGVCQDVTEQRDAERRELELARSEAAREQVTRILESITDAFFALDTDWRFTYVNAEAETLLRRGREGLLGRSLWDEFPEAVDSPFHREYHRALATGMTVEFVEFYPPLESWFEVKVYPSAEGLSVYFRNVNDRKQAEQALRRSEERFRAVQETSPDGFMVFESVRGASGSIEDFEWVYVNPAAAAMVGRSATDLLGRRLLQEMPGNRAEGLFADYVRVVETGERSQRLFRYQHEGLDHWFRNTAVRVRDGFAVAFADVTAEKQAELALKHQSDLLRTVTDNATGALFMMDAEGRCTFMNPAAEAMTGFSLDEIREVPLHEAIHHHHPDGRAYPVSECPIDSALPGDGSVTLHEDVFIRKSGEFFPVVCAARPIQHDGVPIGTVLEVRDITREKAAQQALRESEQRYRSLVDATAAIVWNTPASGEFSGDQAGWRDFTGQTETEYLGWGWLARVHPADRERTAAAWKQAVEQGTMYQVEHRIRRRDGEYRVMVARGVPIRDETGALREWVGVHTDITVRKRMQEHQRVLAEAGSVLASSLDYEATLAGVTRLAVPTLADWCAIDILAEDGALSRVDVAHADPLKRQFALELEARYPADPAAETGVYHVLRTGEPELVSEISDDLVAAIARDDEHLRLLRELGLRSYLVVPMVARGRRLGAITLVAAESGLRFDEADLETAQELALRAAFAVDNARLFADQVHARREVERKAEELARLAEALERSNRELDQFAYVTSHDLKAPLRGIANLAQWIEEDFGERLPGEVQEHLQLLKGRVHRMESLIEGILRYSRADRLRGEVERVDVGALVDEVVELLDPPEAVEVRVTPGLPVLATERLPLQQVFMNLIGNAVKYLGRPEGEVRVEACDRNGVHEFSVVDNGPGIAPEYHDRIFGIFQTLEARDRVEGTGIGLSLVKKIVEHRGGRVWVESEEGSGATFRFTWPA